MPPTVGGWVMPLSCISGRATVRPRESSSARSGKLSRQTPNPPPPGVIPRFADCGRDQAIRAAMAVCRVVRTFVWRSETSQGVSGVCVVRRPSISNLVRSSSLVRARVELGSERERLGSDGSLRSGLLQGLPRKRANASFPYGFPGILRMASIVSISPSGCCALMLSVLVEW